MLTCESDPSGAPFLFLLLARLLAEPIHVFLLFFPLPRTASSSFGSTVRELLYIRPKTLARILELDPLGKGSTGDRAGGPSPSTTTEPFMILNFWGSVSSSLKGIFPPQNPPECPVRPCWSSVPGSCFFLPSLG